MRDVLQSRSALEAVLEATGPVAVAVSGGVDSMVLAWVAHRRDPESVTLFHALSPAVPAAATARVQDYARRERWRLAVLDAGEFADPAYRANPVDRCFHCKSHLYAAIAARTGATVVSGTNLDDLGDYRPGLDAARERGVRHPHVDARLDKNEVRALARHLGLTDLAELPASPCLSSRVETGIRIERAQLALIERVEDLIRTTLGADTVRCRIRHSGPVIELDAAALARVQSSAGEALRTQVTALCASRGAPRFEAYRQGSAFLRA